LRGKKKELTGNDLEERDENQITRPKKNETVPKGVPTRRDKCPISGTGILMVQEKERSGHRERKTNEERRGKWGGRGRFISSSD